MVASEPSPKAHNVQGGWKLGLNTLAHIYKEKARKQGNTSSEQRDGGISLIILVVKHQILTGIKPIHTRTVGDKFSATKERNALQHPSDKQLRFLTGYIPLNVSDGFLQNQSNLPGDSLHWVLTGFGSFPT